MPGRCARALGPREDIAARRPRVLISGVGEGGREPRGTSSDRPRTRSRTNPPEGCPDEMTIPDDHAALAAT